MTEGRPALTELSEEERMFQEAVGDFAAAEIAPRVARMDRAGAIDPDLLPQLFEAQRAGLPRQREGAPHPLDPESAVFWPSAS